MNLKRISKGTPGYINGDPLWFFWRNLKKCLKLSREDLFQGFMGGTPEKMSNGRISEKILGIS